MWGIFMMDWKEKIDAFLEKGFEEDADIDFGDNVNPMQVVKYLEYKGFELFDDDGDKRHHIINMVKDGYILTVWVTLWYYDVSINWSRKEDE